MQTTYLYISIADQYQKAIEMGQINIGDKFPSMRSLMQRHQISLSTSIQVCRHLETLGFLDARPRSGNYVSRPRRNLTVKLSEPIPEQELDPAQFVGINARISEFVAKSSSATVKVNFSGAHAYPEHYPGKALRKAAAQAIKNNPDIYVKSASKNGDPTLRSVLAKRALTHGISLTSHDVLITQGCIEALNLALKAVTKPGDVVAVESPAYFGLLQLLEALGLKVIEIPTSPLTGISLDALWLAVQLELVKAVIVVPYLQNPLGACMPESNMQLLVNLCRQHDIALIEDDSYSALLNDNAPRRALKSFDTDGSVIHCASLHKSLAPGMRLGWINAGRWHARVEMLKYTQSRNNEALSQIAAASFIDSPEFERHLQRLRSSLKKQRAQMADAVGKYFPQGTRMNEPEGGLSLWIELPNHPSSESIFKHALEQGIIIAPGTIFSNSNRFSSFIRLNCGATYTDSIDAAMKTLGKIIKHHTKV